MRFISIIVGLSLLTACTSGLDQGTPSESISPTLSPEQPIATTASSGSPTKTEKPKRTFRTEPRPGEVVYYRLHPDHDRVDRYCGAHDRSYIVKHVEVPDGSPAVLRHALEAHFGEYWDAADTIGTVSATEGRAIVDLRSTDGIGFAGTSCGGVGFVGSVLRTIFQFENIEEAELRLRGSCKNFGVYMQTARCDILTRDNL